MTDAIPTREQLLEAIRKKPLLIHTCSICEYRCCFYFVNDVFGYDIGCDCTYGRGGWSPRDINELDFYLDPRHGWLEIIRQFVGSETEPSD